jgi:pilus assembly protein CpaB
MNRRPLVLAGCGIFVIIIGVVVLALSRENDAKVGESPPATARVVVATQALAPNETGSDLASSGKVEVREVEAAKVAPGALTDLGQLAGREVKVAIAEGQQVTVAALTRPPLRSSAVKVPAGTEAVAITTPFTPGGAGYFAPGDRVNVLTMLDANGDLAAGAGNTRLVAQQIEVLDVSAEVPPRVASVGPTTTIRGETTSTTAVTSQASLTYLLAIPSDQVEKVVQAAAFHQVYLSLPADGAAPRTVGSASDADLGRAQR